MMTLLAIDDWRLVYGVMFGERVLMLMAKMKTTMFDFFVDWTLPDSEHNICTAVGGKSC